MKPVIGVVLGDAAGIGPEIVARISADDNLLEFCRPLLIGDLRVLKKGMKVAEVDFPLRFISDISEADWKVEIPMLDLHNLDPSSIITGQINAESGRRTGETLIRAMELCRQGTIAGFAFAPYHKAAMEYGGYPLIDQGVSLFARHLAWDRPFGEVNVAGDLWTSRVTSHMPLKNVSEHLTGRRILGAIRLINHTLQLAGIDKPRIAVAALNPHGGEDGLCGREEIEIIQPAVRAAREEEIDALGPFPADTLFVNALKGMYDGVTTMYHDQGQIALKLVGFESGVTVLAGLPYPLTTPAHGTAFDIAGKGVADPEAMRQAVITAARMAGWRKS